VVSTCIARVSYDSAARTLTELAEGRADRDVKQSKGTQLFYLLPWLYAPDLTSPCILRRILTPVSPISAGTDKCARADDLPESALPPKATVSDVAATCRDGLGADNHDLDFIR
jgi:hypothetical protein